MRNEAAARRSNQVGTTVSPPASGRRMKAARPQGSQAELALSLTDALEHILEDEQRTA